MCGLFGYVGIDEPVVLARALCALNEERGEHSAGIATVSPALGETIVKRDIRPTRFILTPRFVETVAIPHRVLIGHTRWATHGGINKDNAHPWRMGVTVGCHNGIVGNLKGVSEFCGQEFQVDSQYLIYMLDRFGHLGPARGSLNVTYFGRKDSADLRVIRWNNPLFYSTPGGKSLIYSSEAAHLRIAMSVAGIKGEIHEFEDGAETAIYLHENRRIELTVRDAPFGPSAEMARYKHPEAKPVKSWKEYKTPAGGAWIPESEISPAPRTFNEMTTEEWEAWCEYESRGE